MWNFHEFESLYKRVFLGIDKECEQKNEAGEKDNYTFRDNILYSSILIYAKSYISFTLYNFFRIPKKKATKIVNFYSLFILSCLGIKFIINIFNNSILSANFFIMIIINIILFISNITFETLNYKVFEKKINENENNQINDSSMN